MENRKFKAILYSGNAKFAGFVTLEARHLIFTAKSDGGPTLKWDEYSITAAFEDELVGLHSTLEPGKSVFVQDGGFAAALAKELKIEIRSSFIHWWARRPFRAAMGITAIIFLTTTLMLAFLRTQGKYFARFVTHEQEVAIGMAALEKTVGKGAVNLPPRLKQDWDALMNTLLDQPSLKGYKWNVYIAGSPEVNAYALPGGFITFNSAFIQQAESSDEILGVLAHEAAHVTQRHSVQSLAGGMSANILLSVLFLGSSNVLSGLIYAADGLHSLKYSRGHESEADRYGVHYLQQAGLSTDGMYAFFSRKRPDAAELNGSLNYLSTHPMDEQRLRLIRRLDPNHAGKKTAYDLGPLKKFLENYKR